MIKILVPVDFSENSLNALRYAIHFFGPSDLAITVLYSYKTASTAFHMKSMDRILKEDAERQMDDLVEKMKKEEPDVRLTPKIFKGDAVSIITSVGDSEEFDFVVMGTTGASGLKEVFIGSVAGGVMAEIESPVLVIPSGCTYEPVDKIVLAISESPVSSAAVFDPLRKIASLQESELNVVHISDDENPEKPHALDLIQDMDPSVTYTVDTGDINQRLNRYLKENQVQLLCLVRSRKGFLNRLFFKSVTMKQTFSSTVPLLILHE